MIAITTLKTAGVNINLESMYMVLPCACKLYSGTESLWYMIKSAAIWSLHEKNLHVNRKQCITYQYRSAIWQRA